MITFNSQVNVLTTRGILGSANSISSNGIIIKLETGEVIYSGSIDASFSTLGNLYLEGIDFQVYYTDLILNLLTKSNIILNPEETQKLNLNIESINKLELIDGEAQDLSLNIELNNKVILTENNILKINIGEITSTDLIGIEHDLQALNLKLKEYNNVIFMEVQNKQLNIGILDSVDIFIGGEKNGI